MTPPPFSFAPPTTSKRSPYPFNVSSTPWIAICLSPTWRLFAKPSESPRSAPSSTRFSSWASPSSHWSSPLPELYGVLAYLVTQRTNELGVRIALGAQRAQILRLTLLDGLRPALLGLIVGLAGSAAVAKLIRSLLYDIEPYDSTVFLAVITILLAVAALACTIPAWRASRLDPLQALRVD